MSQIKFTFLNNNNKTKAKILRNIQQWILINSFYPLTSLAPCIGGGMRGGRLISCTLILK